MQGNGTAAAGVRIICRSLLLLGIALAFSITFTAGTRASDLPDAGSYENLDTRWLPWIGSWRLVSDTVNTDGSALKEEYLMTVSPGGDGKSVTVKGYRDETVLSEEKIITDGQRHPLTDDKCSGWYSYSWSETGKRLLLNSESICTGDLSHLISGMSIINENGDWLDIQSLQSGEEKAVTIRRYRNVDSGSVTPASINAAEDVFARLSAGTNFSIDEIIELSSKVEPEVLEVALSEIRKPFQINSKQLVRLADAEVPSQIVDLMVALSFPDKFTVEQTTISRVQKAEVQQNYPPPPPPYRYWPYEYPGYPWHWGSSIYSPYYDYWRLGWNGWYGWYDWYGWYYPYWGYPYYSGGGYADTGRLVEGRGYARVSSGSSNPSPRYAQPRNAPEGQEAISRPTSSFSYGTSSWGYSSGSSSGSSTSSGSDSPCASPSGYSRGDCD